MIVNLPDEYYAKGFGVGYEKYTQTQRLEQCMYPGAPCSYLDPHYPSSCLQKHNFVRLLAYTFDKARTAGSSFYCNVITPRVST